MTYINNSIQALADPTRREIFERIGNNPMAVGQLAAQMPVSRPAVSQHLAVLKQAGLVRDEAKGTQRIYRVDPRGLVPLRQWLDQFWGEALAGFATHIKDQNIDEKSEGSEG